MAVGWWLGWLTMAAGAGEPVLPAWPVQVRELASRYVAGFGAASTGLCYHHRLDGPRGVEVLSPPEEIQAGRVRGQPMPYGYGSGIQDVALENGHFLFALCEAWEATRDPGLAELARGIFAGLKRLAEVTPEPGFVPRGPHPDGVSYYHDSSRDQHCAYVEALWRYGRTALAGDEDRRFIATTLGNIAARMERYDWRIMVEDGSAQAHVGFAWTQRTSVGATTLLSVLAEVADATGDEHWREAYQQFSAEGDGYRWRELLASERVSEWPPNTLYSNQFLVGMLALARLETDPSRQAQLREFIRGMARRALDSDVFDPELWRRLDWAGDWTVPQITAALQPFGLRLDRPTTVAELLAAFKPEVWDAGSAGMVYDLYGVPAADGVELYRLRRVADKLCFGLPTVACHMALLSEDPALVAEVAPLVERMVQVMNEHGQHYTGGENFNRATVLGLHLLAQQASSTARP